ncbi:MAG TPA: hypothetical protein VHI13_22875 [Candidatus Kapabacteria bacterium]|nr:hypothetical protein [Candidatus Kapabacteria bacterium]
MNIITMKAAPALRNDIRCALTVAFCSIVNIVAGYNTALFNIGLIYGVLSWFLARFFYLRLVEKKSAAVDIYPMIMGVVIPALTIGMLLLVRGGALDFCFGMFVSIAFYNGLYLGMSKKPVID